MKILCIVNNNNKKVSYFFKLAMFISREKEIFHISTCK